MAKIVCDHFDSCDTLTNLSSPVCVPAALNQIHHIAAVHGAVQRKCGSIYRDFCVFIFISKSNYSLHLNNTFGFYTLESIWSSIHHCRLSVVLYLIIFTVFVYHAAHSCNREPIFLFSVDGVGMANVFHGIASQSTEINCLLLIPKRAQCIMHLAHIHRKIVLKKICWKQTLVFRINRPRNTRASCVFGHRCIQVW